MTSSSLASILASSYTEETVFYNRLYTLLYAVGIGHDDLRYTYELCEYIPIESYNYYTHNVGSVSLLTVLIGYKMLGSATFATAY